MGIIMQSFYWDCPKLESKEFEWWTFLKEKIKDLSGAGFTAIWLPPASKAGNLFGGCLWAMIPMTIMTLVTLTRRGIIADMVWIT